MYVCVCICMELDIKIKEWNAYSYVFSHYLQKKMNFFLSRYKTPSDVSWGQSILEHKSLEIYQGTREEKGEQEQV